MTLEEAYEGGARDSVINFSKFNGQAQFNDSNPKFLKRSHQPSNKLFIYYYTVKMNNFVFSLKGRNFKYNADIILAFFVNEDTFQPYDLELQDINKIVAEEQDSARAIAVVQKLSEELGLKQVQPKSYLRLVLEKMNG